MAAKDTSQIRSHFKQLSKGANLEVLLPRSSHLDISSIVRDGSPDDLSRVPSRRNLFFDEKAGLLLVLKTSFDVESVRALLLSLEIVVAAYATDAVPQGNGNTASASGKHDVTSQTVPGPEATNVISAGDYTYVTWKTTLHLLRPRAKTQRPAVYFTAHLTVSAKALDALNQRGKDLLKSFEPLPANILESLHFDPSLSGSDIYLSEARVTKVAPPVAETNAAAKLVRGASKRAFPIVPALFTRVRYSTLPEAVIASLHLETTQVVAGTVVIRNVTVNVNVPNVHLEALCPVGSTHEAQAGDETISLYKLTLASEGSIPSDTALFVSIEAVVSTDQGSKIDLDIKWQAPVDLSPMLSTPSYTWSRPLSASAHSTVRTSTLAAERPSSMNAKSKDSIDEGGITFNFTANPTVVRNEELSLHVQCINRSARTRRFALVILQTKRSHIRIQQQQGPEDTTLIANLFNAPPLERPRPPGVLDLNPDVRVGPLPPGACFETQMKFRATNTGVLDLGVIRIVDLDTRQTVDVRELPDVIALETSVEETEPLEPGPDDAQ